MKPDSINRKAFDLLENAKIAARLGKLRRPAVEAAQVTLEDHLRQLADIRDKAVAAGLGIEDQARTERALRGIVGKRLTSRGSPEEPLAV